ncbi:hypothetical protein K491DRAFT_734676 [Lophiostoma macrostomum CBS 122681]|uniref:UbiA prenyltransferase n=1 Tax=Lophiostoma macrostomum CBS 122681 TaxID=1314788 RepID=A0A6A6SPK5_9PLEO|nr:hypothetical protein K491DRAFT_734676 [Lophiostoma macrostomum CBS 122681]
MSTLSPRKALHNVYTIWLFTRSDLKTIVVPSTFFAFVFASCGPGVYVDRTPSAMSVVRHVPRTVFWVWINLLPFAIENQRQPDSVVEDAENKPWRPLPSKRLTARQAVRLMVAFYTLAVVVSLALGGIVQCLALVILGYWYNDLSGANCSCITRNFINGCGYVCFLSGALEVISGRSVFAMNPTACRWLATIGLVVFTTVQAQDMPDQAGDSLRSRWTVPLVIGDAAARCTLALGVAVWSYACPAYWGISANGFIVTIPLGIIVVARFLLRRSMQADRLTFRLYNMWMVSLYLLPLVKTLDGLFV